LGGGATAEPKQKTRQKSKRDKKPMVASVVRHSSAVLSEPNPAIASKLGDENMAAARTRSG